MSMRDHGTGIAHAALRCLAGVASALVLAGGAAAQTFPSKPVRLLLGSPAGGPLDLVTRLVAERMAAPLGQPVIVENRIGASGIIAVDAVIKSTADGYNIVMLTSPALLNGLLNGREWKPAEEFTPIGLNYQQGILMGVNPSVPLFSSVKTASDLVRVVKANPGKVNYATAGPTGTGNIAGLMMSSGAGLQWQNVPYKGGAEMVRDLVAGENPIVAMGPTVQDAANNPGRLLLIATTGGKVQSGIRPLAEQGFPNIKVTTWGGIVGPGRLPAATAERLSVAYRTAVVDGAFIEKMAKILEQEYLPPTEFGQMIQETIALYQKLARENNLRPN